MDIDELESEIKEGTINNRDDLIQIFDKLENNEIILFMIETFKSYCHIDHDEEGVTAAQYMIFLDAAQTVLTERKFLPEIETWTLEEFLNGKPFHSLLVDE
jgi:hypothetical protein